MNSQEIVSDCTAHLKGSREIAGLRVCKLQYVTFFINFLLHVILAEATKHIPFATYREDIMNSLVIDFCIVIGLEFLRAYTFVLFHKEKKL